MELWYSENWCADVKFSIKVTEHLYHKQSHFQKIDIFDSKVLGKFLTLDGLMVVNEKDEFIYHEMVVHVSLAVNPNIKNVLIIGGGECGSARELLKYKTIENIDLVEVDKEVVNACMTYFPYAKDVSEDKRINIIYMYGDKYVSCCDKKYDLIIVDSTFPILHGEGLLTTEFYKNCYNILVDDGILVNQNESPYFDDTADKMRRSYSKIKKIFPIASVYQAHIPTYPSGHWLFGFASKKYHPTKDVKAFKWHNLNIDTKYYNNDLHIGAFMLPTYVKKMLDEV